MGTVLVILQDYRASGVSNIKIVTIIGRCHIIYIRFIAKFKGVSTAAAYDCIRAVPLGKI